MEWEPESERELGRESERESETQWSALGSWGLEWAKERTGWELVPEMLLPV
jgi:hypothetical protein